VRFIEKGREPPLLRNWKWENSRLQQNLSYSNIPQQALAELRETLLRGQGYLCAYTMMRIASSDKGHIEHVQPRWRYPKKELEYGNMVYCVPGSDAATYEFGAKRKDSYDATNSNFVSPLSPTCETRLAYDSNGNANANRANDFAARKTIDVLNLNHGELIALRKAAIRSQPIFRRAAKPLSAAEARALAVRVMQRDEAGKIPSYCVAIKQVALHFAKQREAYAAGITKRRAK